MPVIAFHQLSDHPHAESDASFQLGGEERLERTMNRRLIHAYLRVEKGNSHAFALVIAPIPRWPKPYA
jgi:hypothetical protein